MLKKKWKKVIGYSLNVFVTEIENFVPKLYQVNATPFPPI